MNSKAITIKDIARLAGVSTATVDRVLHKRGQVSSIALKKIMAVLNEHEYKPNLLARTLGSNKRIRIAALIPDPSSDPYWEKVSQGVDQARNEWAQYSVNIHVFLFDQYSKKSYKKKALEALKANPDGILTSPIFYDEALPILQMFKENAIPYVLFNTNIPETQPLTFIGQDLFSSGQVGAQLMDLDQNAGGMLAVLHLSEDIHNSRHLSEKERGFRDFFKRTKRLNNNPKMSGFDIVEFNLSADDPSFNKKLNDLLDDETLKGIFVTTSKGTSMVASYLEKRGKNGTRLIGYDMLEENLKYLRSGVIDFLINQNPKNQTFRGISHLVNHLLFKKKAPVMDLFPLEIITRWNVESYLFSEKH